MARTAPTNSPPPRPIGHARCSVSFVAAHDLCTGCGTCLAVCPARAVSMHPARETGTLVSRIDPKTCRGCGMCVRVCPGYTIELPAGSAGEPYNREIGRFRHCYMGHATNDEIYADSSSGGLTTAIVKALLDDGEIDGAVVTRMCPENPLAAEAFIATSAEALVSSQKSKYCPVAVNAVLGEVCRRGGRYALVGLPCHIEGLHKLFTVKPALREQITHTVGLFCSRLPTFNATRFLLESRGIPESDVRRIEYRGGGHPGRLCIELRDGTRRTIGHRSKEYWGYYFQYHFMSPRCWLCPDKTAELADFSVGDNWSRASRAAMPRATSVLIARTGTAAAVLDRMVEQGRIAVREMPVDTLVALQNIRKKRDAPTKARMWSVVGKTIPEYHGISTHISPATMVRGIPQIVRIGLSYRSPRFRLIRLLGEIEYLTMMIYRGVKLGLYAIRHPLTVLRYVRGTKEGRG